MPEAAPSRRWSQVALVLVTAFLVVVAADIGLRRIARPKYVREVADAMRDYETEDPTTLVLGSSHARTFVVMDGMVRGKTGGKERILTVPVEWGKFRSYEWVLRHRIEPLVEEKDASGKLKRPSLKRFIFQTAWWDDCWNDKDPPAFNLPSRAWTLSHFANDVLAHGINDYNRNYVTSRWGEMWHGSIFVSDRGQNRLIAKLREMVRPFSEEQKAAQFQTRLASWQEIISRGKTCRAHPEELAAAERIIDWAKGRGYDVTMILYPMMPITITDDTRHHVMEPFELIMKQLAEKKGIKIIDVTFDNGGIEDKDFQPDFDHLTRAGHEKLGRWLLEGPMEFLFGYSDAPTPTPTPATAPTPAPTGALE